jgi:hypothetical protein
MNRGSIEIGARCQCLGILQVLTCCAPCFAAVGEIFEKVDHSSFANNPYLVDEAEKAEAKANKAVADEPAA